MADVAGEADHAGPPRPGQGSRGTRKDKSFVIEVNGRRVQMPEKRASGLEIKTQAIAQQVPIQLNFVLQEELANGSSRIVGDSDEVKLHEHISFTAIAPDDNS